MKVKVASVSQKEIDDILSSSVRGGTLTVSHVLDMKHAKVEGVVVEPGTSMAPDGRMWQYQATTSISSPDWAGESVMLGNGHTPFEAAFASLQRMATMLVRS